MSRHLYRRANAFADRSSASSPSTLQQSQTPEPSERSTADTRRSLDECETQHERKRLRLDQDDPPASEPLTSSPIGCIDWSDYLNDGPISGTDTEIQDLLPSSWDFMNNSSISNRDDEFTLTPSEEGDLAQLADLTAPATASTGVSGMPPSSIIRGMSFISSDEVFDPNLRGSTPGKSPKEALQNQEVDLLDHDIVWDQIFASLPDHPKDYSLCDARKLSHVSGQPDSSNIGPKWTQTTTQNTIDDPRPFVRPKFQDPVKGKSPIAGVSAETKVRTCFRIGEMLNQAKKVATNKEDVIFELYARVVCSSREGLRRVQHFRFMDLYTVRQPHPGGRIEGWKMGSLLDQQSLALVTTEGMYPKKICRCLGRLVRDTKTAIGWSLDILTIRESDWDEVELMRQLICKP